MFGETPYYQPSQCRSFSYIPKPQGMDVLGLNLILNCHVFLPYIMNFVIEVNHQIIQTKCSHAPRYHHCYQCHYCNVDFALFHNATCYTNSFVSRRLVNTTYSLRFKIKVTFGHKMRYKIKVTFGEISLKLRQTNWNVAINDVNVVVDGLPS